MPQLPSQQPSQPHLSRQASLKRPINNHASALPQYAEYVVETPVSGVAPTIPLQEMEYEDHIFFDPVAFRYLEEEPYVRVISRREYLFGYEVYLVEQWAVNRLKPTFIICTYTGDSTHRITVSFLRIPKNPALWSKRLSVYLKEVTRLARPKTTAQGTLMITNLSSFPSNLTVIPIPGGDFKPHRSNFIVNFNLKRLACSVRSITLITPTDTAQQKFHSLFLTSPRNNFSESVTELVRLCQVALVLFDLLKARYADGLLCDLTEKALKEFWSEFGVDYYNHEPLDGVLGPTTVAALLGLLLGARNRLSLCGAPVPKDAFELNGMTKGIHNFQRSQRLTPRSGRLDRQTLDRLHKLTNGNQGKGPDIFAVPRAIKSTVVDLSQRATGAGGTGKEEPGAPETTDMERFRAQVSGEQGKWLWFGKPKKPTIGPHSNQPSRKSSFENHRNTSVSDDEGGGSVISGFGRSETTESVPQFHMPPGTTFGSIDSGRSEAFRDVRDGRDSRDGRESRDTYHLQNTPTKDTTSSLSAISKDHQSPITPPSKDGKEKETVSSDLRKAVLGIKGRIKDATQDLKHHTDSLRRGHQRQNTKDAIPTFDISAPASPVLPVLAQGMGGRASEAIWQSQNMPDMTGKLPNPGTGSSSQEPSIRFPAPIPESTPFPTSHSAPTTQPSTAIGPPPGWGAPTVMVGGNGVSFSSCHPYPPQAVSLPSSPLPEHHDQHPSPAPTHTSYHQYHEPPHARIRRKSCSHLQPISHHESWYPHRLSFSLAEDAILTWTPSFSPPDSPVLDTLDIPEVLGVVEFSQAHIKALDNRLEVITANVVEFERILGEKEDRVGRLRREQREKLEGERERVKDEITEAEVLGARMQYELGVVRGKLLDLEESVVNLEKWVGEVEEAVAGVEEGEGGSRRGWWGWWR
ncbi:hypothetical protein BZA77DRAFT_388771 [Pyronema omphalodes]|nr:hypothetical protein BZA77DRAFT_388771 [Pyronema omphalodes]